MQEMSERKQQILKTALEIIADEGYSGLSMRALARASDMKLGALQYHYRTWEDLLRALVSYIETKILEGFEARKLHEDSATVGEIAAFMLADSAGTEDAMLGDRLWPQLWAMEQVEPLVSDLLEDVYERYVAIIERAIEKAGGNSPRAEALCLISMLEGESLFTGSGRRWESDRKVVRETILKFIDERY